MDVRGQFAELRQHKVDMRQNLGEKTGLDDIPTLEEAIAAVDAVPAGGEYASVGGKKVVLFPRSEGRSRTGGLVGFITERGLQRRTSSRCTATAAAASNHPRYPEACQLRRAYLVLLRRWRPHRYKISAMARHENVDAIGVPYEKPTGASQGSMGEGERTRPHRPRQGIHRLGIHRRSVTKGTGHWALRGFILPRPLLGNR